MTNRADSSFRAVTGRTKLADNVFNGLQTTGRKKGNRADAILIGFGLGFACLSFIEVREAVLAVHVRQAASPKASRLATHLATAMTSARLRPLR
jgi:hypothetical protein